MIQPINWAPGVSLENVEKQVILNAWSFYRGNKTQCSISLGISIRTLETKLEKYEQDGKALRDFGDREERERAEQLRRARGIVGNPIATALTADPAQGDALGTSSGVHVQPVVEVPAQQPVPVPERPEVQAVLPAKTSGHREHRRR
jgi:hypothetical protein